MDDTIALTDDAGAHLRAALELTLAAGTARFRRRFTWGQTDSEGPGPAFAVGMIDFALCRSCEGFVPSEGQPPTGDFEELEDRFSRVEVQDVRYLYVRKHGRQRWTRMPTGAPAEAGPPGWPKAPLETLWGAGAEVAIIGREAVGGVPATRYQASVGLDEALARAPRSAHFRIKVASRSKLSGSTEFRTDVWVDDDGRVRRMVTHHALGPEEGPHGRISPLDGIEDDYELYDLGVNVEIPVPPRGTVRVSKLMAIAGALDRTWAVARGMRRGT